jgi:UDP-glucose 4-epimerase
VRVLVPGISSPIGQLLAEELLARGHVVAGIDRRTTHSLPDGVEHHELDIRKRAAEDVFRRFRPQVVVHMATVSHFTTRGGGERFRINLGGTRSVFDHCVAHGVEHVVFVGRHTYYGAAADSPLYHAETEPPLALHTFPELADLVAADLFAATALWRFPSLRTTLLRFVYMLGPSGYGTLGSYLRGPRVPTVLGFDPLFQFMHERDVVEALVRSIEQRPHGVFNVAGPAPVPLSLLIRGTGRRPLPLPEPLLPALLGRLGLPRLPPGAVQHLKFPLVVDGAPFARETGFEPRFDERATMDDFRRARPV